MLFTNEAYGYTHTYTDKLMIAIGDSATYSISPKNVRNVKSSLMIVLSKLFFELGSMGIS